MANRKYNNIVKSEITTEKGAYNEQATALSQDARKMAAKLYKKHEKNLSTMAIHHIICIESFSEMVFANALSIKY